MTDPLNDLAEEVRDLSRQVAALGEAGSNPEHLRERLAKLETDLLSHTPWLADAPAQLDDATNTLIAHDERLAEGAVQHLALWKEVNKLLEEMPRQPKYPPVCWLRLTAEEAAVAWRDLADWVDAVLVARFFATRAQLPDCWPLHPAAVEHLTWLWTAWLHAYLKTAGAVPAAEWHTRWLRDALNLVPEAIAHEGRAVDRVACTPGVHFGSALPGHAPSPSGDPDPAAPLSYPPLADASDPLEHPDFGALSSMDNPDRIGRHASADLAVRSFWQPALSAASTDDVQRRAAHAAADAPSRDQHQPSPPDDQEIPPPDDRDAPPPDD